MALLCACGKLILVFSIWRPFIPVIDDAPLAFCDRRSVKRSDLVPYDKILADRDAENAFLKYREYHKWYWMSKQTIDEPCIFVVWDSLDLEKGSEDAPGEKFHTILSFYVIKLNLKIMTRG